MSVQQTTQKKKANLSKEEMDDLLGTSGSVTIAASEKSKRSIFQKPGVDTSFLDNPGEAENGEAGTDDDDPNDGGDDPLAGIDNPDDGASDNPDAEGGNPDSGDDGTNPDDITATIDALNKSIDTPAADDNPDDEPDTKKSKGGRKPALVEVMGQLIEEGVISPFSDNDDLSTYKNEDIKDLISANIQQKVSEAAKNAPIDVFKRLDPKLQEVVAFNLNGGKNIGDVLRAVGQAEEITNLDVENEKDQERIIREWYRSTDVMSEEEIDDEIAGLADRGELKSKAEIFKPKLDKKQASIMEKKLADQEEKKAAAEKAKEDYAEVVHGVLNNPTLNGLPLNERTQYMLYYGLVDDTQHTDRNGNPVNALGHLIEEYQFGKNANPSVLLEALWLLADPKGYRENVQSLGQKAATKKTARTLKTAEETKITASNKTGDKREAPSRKTVARPTGKRNIFSR